MTKEEFREGIEDMLKDVADPNGDFASMRKEFEETAAGVKDHDLELSRNIAMVADACERLAAYVVREYGAKAQA